jgi:hypothetical protein
MSAPALERSFSTLLRIPGDEEVHFTVKFGAHDEPDAVQIQEHKDRHDGSGYDTYTVDLPIHVLEAIHAEARRFLAARTAMQGERWTEIDGIGAFKVPA